MMISSVLALLLAAAAMQPTDTTRAARETYTACLRHFVEHSIDGHMSAADFTTQFPQQCTQQETNFRNAVIAREIASRARRPDAEQAATDEIDEAKTNFRERFEMAMTPSS